MIEMMTVAPAKVLGINKGTLGVGCDADITIIDPNYSWTVDVNQFYSKSQNCPYHGWKLNGRAVYTLVSGEIRFSLDPR